MANKRQLFRILRFLLLIFYLISVRQAVIAVDIIDLGNLGGTNFTPYSVSRDGKTVVGSVIDPSGVQRGFIWTETNGMRYLTEPGVSGGAWGITRDGSKVVGFMTTPGSTTNSNAFRWSAENGFDLLSPVSSSSHGIAVSNDGQTVVGRVQAPYGGNPNGSTWQPAIWVSGSHQATIPSFSPFCLFSSVSGDGSIVTGFGGFPDSPFSSNVAFVWDQVNGVKLLDILDGFSVSNSFEISEDGQWIVGALFSSSTTQAVLWKLDGSATLMQPFGNRSNALSLSNAGELGLIKVGRGEDLNIANGRTAVLWDDLNQAQSLMRILEYQKAIGIGSWTNLVEARKVTYDPQSGLNIVGYGTVNGERHGFLIRGLTSTVPEPDSIILGIVMAIYFMTRNNLMKKL